MSTNPQLPADLASALNHHPIPAHLQHFSVEEVASALRCHVSTVYRLKDKGLIIEKLFGLTVVTAENLSRFLAENKQPLRRNARRR